MYDKYLLRPLFYVSLNNIINHLIIEYEKNGYSFSLTGFDISHNLVNAGIRRLVNDLKIDIKKFPSFLKIKNARDFKVYATFEGFFYHITYDEWLVKKHKKLQEYKGLSFYGLLEKTHPIFEVDYKSYEKYFLLQDVQVAFIALNNLLLKKRDETERQGFNPNISPVYFLFRELDKEVQYICEKLRTKGHLGKGFIHMFCRYGIEKIRKYDNRFSIVYATNFECWLRSKARARRHFANEKLYSLFMSNTTI
uniref:Uncharacterized protein n=1 Tax=Fervidobacterium pennivorans TaxID=93466 RepID=A0A7V4NEI1_FERPE